VIAITPIGAIRLAAAAAALAVLLPAGAEAGFSSQLVPVTTVAGGNSGLGDIAVSPSGEALITWTDGGINDITIGAQRIRPDGSAGAVMDITDGTTRALGPQVDFAPNGRAIVAWVDSAKFGDPQSVRARWIEPNDTMTEPITVRAGGAMSEPGELDLAATSDSGAILAWHNFVSKPLFRIVEAQYVTAGGAVSELILPTSGAGSTHVQVAPNSSGGSLMTWRDSSVEAQAFSPTGVPGTLQTPAPGLIANPELATDGHDHFQLGYKDGSLPSSLEYRALAADAGFGAEQTLDPMTQEQLSGFDIATNSANRSVVAWNRVGESGQTVKARFIANDGAPEATTFSAPAGPGNSAIPSAGIGGLGGAAAAWLQTPAPETREIWGRLFPPGVPPGPPMLLSTQTAEAGVPELEIGAGEVGLVAWDERLPDSGPEPGFQVYARQILPPPSCADANGTIVQGRATRINFECSGLQLVAPTIVVEPDHGTLRDIDAATQSVVYKPTPGYAGTDSFLFKGANRGGTGSTQRASLTVGRDTVRPRVTRFTISSRRIQAGASASRKGRRGRTTFRLRYSETATATIAIERGRKCGKGKGVARRCKKFKKLGALRTKGAGLSASVAMTRSVRSKLRPGRYRATALATDLAGNRSKPRRLGFTVVGG
jgi:hypothetical protein